MNRRKFWNKATKIGQPHNSKILRTKKIKQTLPHTHISLLFEQITETQQIIYSSNLTHEELTEANMFSSTKTHQ
jgi:hypothetical protein